MAQWVNEHLIRSEAHGIKNLLARTPQDTGRKTAVPIWITLVVD